MPLFDPETLALRAAAFLFSEPPLAERFLALTGLQPAALRARLAEPATLASVLSFLEAHEPDLVACAAATGTTAAELVRARMQLEGSG